MRTPALLTCCLLVAVLLAAPIAAGTPAASQGTADSPAIQSSLQSADLDNETGPETIEIEVQADGDARIVLSKTFPASTDAERTAFQQVANDFQSGQYDLGFSAFPTIVDRVADSSDREMAITDDGAHSYRNDDVGHLEYRFTWTNFADASEDNATIGPSFYTDDGPWLDELRAGQRLVIRAPSGYSIVESPSGPEIDDDALIWTGPTSFQQGDLTVAFDESSGGSSLPTTTLAIVGLLVAFLAISGWRLARRDEDDSVGDRIDALLASTESETAADEADPTAATDGATAQPTDATTRADAAADTEVSASEPAGAAGAVDSELLSDEERVEQLLEANGGRMKQATIVSETGWSNAKVSQLLSQMDDEERVDKLRIGRENLITLPDVDVTEQE